MDAGRKRVFEVTIDGAVRKLARRNSEDAMDLIDATLGNVHDLSEFVVERVLSHRQTYGGSLTVVLGRFGSREQEAIVKLKQEGLERNDVIKSFFSGSKVQTALTLKNNEYSYYTAKGGESVAPPISIEVIEPCKFQSFYFIQSIFYFYALMMMCAYG